MKYLKSLQFLNESQDSNTFEPITYNAYSDLLDGVISFTDRQIKDMMILYPHRIRVIKTTTMWKKDEDEYTYLKINTGVRDTDASFGIFFKNATGKLIEISVNCLPDEWYLVFDGFGNWYKCDQWDGLLDCLDQWELYPI